MRGFFNGYSILDIANSDDLANFSTLSDDASALYGFVGADFYSQFFNRTGTRVPDDNKIFRQHEYSFFGQDGWKVRRNLTVGSWPALSIERRSVRRERKHVEPLHGSGFVSGCLLVGGAGDRETALQ